MPEWILDLASELPMLGLALGFLFLMQRFVSAENVRRDKADVLHAAQLKDQNTSFLTAISTVSGECHASQDRASTSLKDIADATNKTGDTMIRIDGKLDLLVTMAKP